MRTTSLCTALAASATTLALAAGPAFAGNAHFIASQTSVSSNGTSLVVKFKEAGLESGSTSTIRFSAHLDMTVQCVNGGNKVPSDPKKTTISSDVSQSGDFTAAKNGNLIGTLSVGAPSASSVLDCPGGQKATVTALSWSNALIEDLDTGAFLWL